MCVCVYTYTYIYTHKVEYYSAITKKEILPFVTTWMELEDIMLSEISQSKKKSHLYVKSKNKKNRRFLLPELRSGGGGVKWAKVIKSYKIP